MNALERAWHNVRNPPTVNELKYLRIHKYVKRSYIPHSKFVTIHDEYAEEVAAMLCLLGHTRKYKNFGLTKWYVSVDNYIINVSLHRDAENEWILTELGLQALEVI